MSFHWGTGADGGPAWFFPERGERWFWPGHGIRMPRGPLVLFLYGLVATPGEGLSLASGGNTVPLIEESAPTGGRPQPPPVGGATSRRGMFPGMISRRHWLAIVGGLGLLVAALLAFRRGTDTATGRSRPRFRRRNRSKSAKPLVGSAERKAIELAKSGGHEEALKALLGEIGTDLARKQKARPARAPGLHLWDLYALVAARWGRTPEHLGPLLALGQRALPSYAHDRRVHGSIAHRLEKWSHPESEWWGEWTTPEKRKSWAGLPI